MDKHDGAISREYEMGLPDNERKGLDCKPELAIVLIGRERQCRLIRARSNNEVANTASLIITAELPEHFHPIEARQQRRAKRCFLVIQECIPVAVD